MIVTVERNEQRINEHDRRIADLERDMYGTNGADGLQDWIIYLRRLILGDPDAGQIGIIRRQQLIVRLQYIVIALGLLTLSFMALANPEVAEIAGRLLGWLLR